MSQITIVGAQWGDEGKGKIVDQLAARADFVVRFQGGNNAGHTLVLGDRTLKLSLLPSGILHPGTVSVIGNGVVVNPAALLSEIESVRAQGVKLDPERLILAETACLILPCHTAVDRAREVGLGGGKIGTTGRGIGPAYEDKVARRALRVCDLAEPETVRARIEAMVGHHNPSLAGLGVPTLDADTMAAEILALAPRILRFARPVWRVLNAASRQGKRILFEGAQAVLLDVDHGTYPFVTSSNTVAGQTAAGSGLGASPRGTIVGVVKAYTTRVGSGPFPTELDDEDGAALGRRGHEFGTVTGRSRRCGWLDGVLLRQTVETGGFSAIAVTKLDVLDGFPHVKLCTEYRLDGRTLDYLPPGTAAQEAIRPVYETFKGWAESTARATRLDALPSAARRYLNRIEEVAGVPIVLISTGPDRQDTISLRELFG